MDSSLIALALKNDMNAYRIGLSTLPQEFIDIHRISAEQNIEELMTVTRCRFIKSEMVSDGWCDGMRVLRVIAEDNNGFRDFRWSDSNGGSWFERCESGGQALVYVPENRPGHI